MDTTQFAADLAAVPDRLAKLGERLDDGLDPVANPGRILILGMGSSVYAAENVALEARASGHIVTVERASATLLPPPAPDLLVIAVSATGRSVEVLAAAEPYRNGLVVVTNNPGSPLADLAHRVVELHAGTEASGVACRTFRHTVLVLRALLGLADSGPAARAAAAANASLLDGRGDWLADLAALLDGPNGVFILSPADRLSSAQQSALMIREVPRRPAFASETGDWSHVDVYLTKTLDYRALLFAGSAWDAQALEWMRERGSTLVTVGAPDLGGSMRVTFPGDDDRLTAVLSELMAAELLASHWLS